MSRELQATRPPTPSSPDIPEPDCEDFDLPGTPGFDVGSGKKGGLGFDFDGSSGKKGGGIVADLDGVPCECITPDVLAAFDGGKSKGKGYGGGAALAADLDCDFDFDVPSGKKGGDFDFDFDGSGKKGSSSGTVDSGFDIDGDGHADNLAPYWDAFMDLIKSQHAARHGGRRYERTRGLRES
eukprot:CAMPEP_0194047702 /NCGR_PEP_ID=MMETSP0009_2-20130614/25205_1 /TAXON_ID=210454 /ORGANISM="Grammatophora oceanica, Strain CCMP 410" /LENGTH=181 /DNA_ID=CAMNT_0038693385 /DNA_START=251 /DNA_END=796 /DNA_ORIENTATION=+